MGKAIKQILSHCKAQSQFIIEKIMTPQVVLLQITERLLNVDQVIIKYLFGNI